MYIVNSAALLGLRYYQKMRKDDEILWHTLLNTIENQYITPYLITTLKIPTQKFDICPVRCTNGEGNIG